MLERVFKQIAKCGVQVTGPIESMILPPKKTIYQRGQWSALLPHSKKVLDLNPPPG